MTHEGYNLVAPHYAFSWHEAERPWKIRLEYVGTTKSGRSSHKFWEVYSTGISCTVYINHGRVGSPGLSNPHMDKDFWEAKKVMEAKLDKGYVLMPGSVRGSPLPAETVSPLIALIYRVEGNPDFGYFAYDSADGLVSKMTPKAAMHLVRSNKLILSRSSLKWPDGSTHQGLHAPGMRHPESI